MGDNSWKVSDLPSDSRGATRTAQRLFGKAGAWLGAWASRACRHWAHLCWKWQPPLSSLSAHSPSSSQGPLKKGQEVTGWACGVLGFLPAGPLGGEPVAR